MTRPIDTVPESVDGDYEVFFADVRYLLTLAPNPFAGMEREDELWGHTSNVRQRITVRTEDKGERLAVDYVQDTIMHELIHVAMSVSGYHTSMEAFSEEAVASVLARPLLRLFADPRNAPVVGLLFPPRILQVPEGFDKLDPSKITSGTWTIPEVSKFGRFEQTDVGPYMDELQRHVSDLAALASREAAGAEEPAPREAGTLAGELERVTAENSSLVAYIRRLAKNLRLDTFECCQGVRPQHLPGCVETPAFD